MQNVDEKFKEQMKGFFRKQTIIMDKKEQAETKIKNISKSLALRVNKKEEDLLFNTTDGFRLKKELQSAFEETTVKNTRYGFCNDWMFSLRENQNKFKKQIIKQTENYQDKTRQEKLKKDNKFDLSPITTNENIMPLQTSGNERQTTTSSFYPTVQTETKYMKVSQTHNSVMYVSLVDARKKLISSGCESNGFDMEKVRKPSINQSKYLKKFTDCKPVKDKLKQMKFINEDMNNIGDLKVNKYFFNN